MHEYDLWPSRAQTLPNKPYINTEAIRAITQPDELSPDLIGDRIDNLLSGQGVNASVFIRSGNAEPSVDLDMEQDVDMTNLRQGLL